MKSSLTGKGVRGSHGSRVNLPPEDSTTMFWWLRNPTAVVYFLRELTGAGIALYVIFALLVDPFVVFGGSWDVRLSEGVRWIGLISAVFHSLTWFWVTVKVTPFDLPRAVEWGGFAGLLVTWGGVSYLLYSFLYVV